MGNEGAGETGRVSGRQSWCACAEITVSLLLPGPAVVGQLQDHSFLSRLSITHLSVGPRLSSARGAAPDSL